MRGLHQSGKVFLEETIMGSASVKSYAAFCAWARGDNTNIQSVIGRTIAKENIKQLDLAGIAQTSM